MKFKFLILAKLKMSEKTQNDEDIFVIVEDIKDTIVDVEQVIEDVEEFKETEENILHKLVQDEVDVAKEMVQDMMSGESMQEVMKNAEEQEEDIVNGLVEEEERVLQKDLTDIEHVIFDLEKFFKDLVAELSKLFSCFSPKQTKYVEEY